MCAFCAEDFYLKAATVNSTELNKDPGAFCLSCPDNAKCDRNTTIKTLKGKRGFWRDSNNTGIYYACDDDVVCEEETCAKVFKGILCESCIDKNEYFDQLDGVGKCTVCPHNATLLVIPGIALGISIIVSVSAL